MTKNKAFNASSYVFAKGEPVLVDANVWIYLYPPASKPQTVEKATYSAVLKSMLQAGAKPKIDAYILSEFFNSYLRIEFNASGGNVASNFKAFRKSAAGQAATKSAAAEASAILQIATVESTELTKELATAALSGVSSGGMDFNDLVISNNCRSEQWKLLTNDSDMTEGGITVITCNKALLAACL